MQRERRHSHTQHRITTALPLPLVSSDRIAWLLIGPLRNVAIRGIIAPPRDTLRGRIVHYKTIHVRGSTVVCTLQRIYVVMVNKGRGRALDQPRASAFLFFCSSQ